ncbi:hypothetical protein L3X38_012902 [Prunus dulcis]|uniref:Reverse transcriptase zinc-binding domain-containing protein n=1 Tax=Prunus dulcis TaxID=3755 RepID=A0AAD4ZGG9_PRUDU|nr:hypothetical protein L3X38_012902 [Prunus dulcis]
MLSKASWRIVAGDSGLWAAMLRKKTGWNIKKLLQALLPEVVKQISSIYVDVEGNRPDTCIWGPTSNGVFSVKTAYELSARFNEVPGSPWKLIWNLKIPPRVKMFTWLLTQKKILTNVQRVRRHLSRDPSCPRCHYHEESLQHLFISCPRVLALWRSFYLPKGLINFFSSDFDSWLKENLCYNAGHIRNLKWSSIFAVACWFIWKWRYRSIFEPHFQMPCRPNQIIVEYHLEWDKANNLLKKATSRTQMFLAWQPPPCGFFKLNIDGSRLGLRQLTVNSDYALVVDMINGDWVDSHPMSVLLTKCTELLKNQWNCSILHVYRETNSAADFLAKMGHHKDLGYHELSSPHDQLQPFLDDDKNGLLRPRFVPV